MVIPQLEIVHNFVWQQRLYNWPIIIKIEKVTNIWPHLKIFSPTPLRLCWAGYGPGYITSNFLSRAAYFRPQHPLTFNFGDLKFVICPNCIVFKLITKSNLTNQLWHHFSDVIVITLSNVIKLTSQDFSILDPPNQKFLATTECQITLHKIINAT